MTKNNLVMANNKINLWVVVGVALVVAVIASIATASITGNVIKLNQDRFGKYQVYTKQEVDAKTLGSNCQSTHMMIYTKWHNVNVTINDLCDTNFPGSKCVTGFSILYGNSLGTSIFGLSDCKYTFNPSLFLSSNLTASSIGIQALCCSH